MKCMRKEKSKVCEQGKILMDCPMQNDRETLLLVIKGLAVRSKVRATVFANAAQDSVSS